MSMLQVVTPNEAHVTEWDPADATQVAAVRAEFDALIAQGYVGFNEGRTPTQTFDPTADEVLVAPIVVAG